MEGTIYNHKADTYSFAYVMYETLFRAVPFGDTYLLQIMNDIIYNEMRPDFPTECEDYPQLKHSPLKELITACWHSFPSSRPDFSEILSKLESYLTEIEEEEENLPPLEHSPREEPPTSSTTEISELQEEEGESFEGEKEYPNSPKKVPELRKDPTFVAEENKKIIEEIFKKKIDEQNKWALKAGPDFCFIFFE